MEIDLHDFIIHFINWNKDEYERQTKEIRKLIQKAIDDNKSKCSYIGYLSIVVKNKLEKDDFSISLYDINLNTGEGIWIITW